MQSAANGFRTLVKICGAVSPDQAREILALGADAVGVVVAAGSVRQVSAEQARSIAGVAPERVVLVGRGSEPEWADLARSWRGPMQIHGPATHLGRPCIRALPSGTPPSSDEPTPLACLLDAPEAGSGKPWAWREARSPWPGVPLILAGGLSPESVAEAIRAVRPWAVDVSSGVESPRGVKDLGKVRDFLRAVRACDEHDGRTRSPQPAGFADLR